MEKLVIKGVECRLNENGVAELNLEHVARGLGFTQTAKSGNEVVRWETIRSYLQEFGIVPTCWDGVRQTGNEGLPEFILENIFYKLCFKAKNETAKGFQDLVTDEILPSIRKHGAYMTPVTIDAVISDPDFGIKLLSTLKDERARNEALQQKAQILEGQNEHLAHEVKVLAPKAEYTDRVLQSTSTYTTTQVAKELGMSGIALNKKLHAMGVQYKQSGQWLLYAKYQGKEYSESRTHHYLHDDGSIGTNIETVWTERGRAFVHHIMKGGVR
jgi:phage antirepressor YoqD-like protein